MVWNRTTHLWCVSLLQVPKPHRWSAEKLTSWPCFHVFKLFLRQGGDQCLSAADILLPGLRTSATAVS